MMEEKNLKKQKDADLKNLEVNQQNVNQINVNHLEEEDL